MKADKHSAHLSRLQECSRAVNERAAGVVASTKSGREQIEERGEPRAGGRWWGAITHLYTHPLYFPLSLRPDTMDFSGLSLIKLKKQEMETQVSAGIGGT